MIDKLNLIYNEQDNLYIYKDNPSINYADGSEDFFIDLFEKLDNIQPYDVSLQKYIKDWATKYHLSYIRTNLLDSVGQVLKKDGRVLELGGGVGAITPWLAKCYKSVDVIEGSYKRAKALRLRTKNTKNVRVFVGDIENVEYLETDYDVVTLIGVMEYIPFYSKKISSYDACNQFLRKVGRCLKDDGILIIAIENKLGAKYFSGCTEDHNNEFFSGIMNYPKKSPITFSRNELEDLLKESGFTNIQFYHVLPDYKLPVLFFKEDPAIYETNPSLFARGLFPDYSGKREFLFSEPLFLESIYKARLLHHFSNSFLVLCSNSGKVNLKTDWIVKKFWNKENTRPEFHHSISFIQNKDQIWVERKPLKYSKNTFIIGDIQFHLNSETFIQGENLNQQAYRSVIADRSYSSLTAILKSILSHLKQEFSLARVDEDGYEYVDGTAIDYCLWNIVQDNTSKLHFIDRKWKYLRAITADFVIFRSIIGLYQDVYPFIEETKLSDFVIKIMQNLFPQYNKTRFDYNFRSEEEFMKQVFEPGININSNITLRKNIIEQLKIFKKMGTDLMLSKLEKRLIKGNIFLWGAGIHTINLLKVLKKIEFPIERIKGIVDSNPDKDGTFINGIPVFSKETFLKNIYKDCANIIISSKSFEDEIYMQLRHLFGNEINLIRLYNNELNVDLFFE